ncbi:hypothetical protein PLICRDRAFT_466165 [Plicaturopsis crispa FD-325 SS-3]|nr:hypothetical protein PLICRDRAFT_466165 [Plicaturopsis crispa FD-325 SS-3]
MAARKTAATAPPVPPKSSKSGPSALIKYYLIAYNALSALGWAYLLVVTLTHIFSASSPTPQSPPTTLLARLFSPILKSTPYASTESKLPTWAVAYYRKAAGTYARTGVITATVQSTALLEVAHALLGWVRSPVQTTAMQVASRLFLVWGITEQFDVARTSPIYTSMLIAWSLSEIPRYVYYIFPLTGRPVPYFLTWIRYTAFYPLYPLGAGSEAALIYLTLPRSSLYPSWQGWLKGGLWGPGDYFRGVLLLVWPPALYVLYTHMIRQRRKVLGAAPGHKLVEQAPGQALERKLQ